MHSSTKAERGEALSLMRGVKEMFGPPGLLNPSKVILVPKQEPTLTD